VADATQSAMGGIRGLSLVLASLILAPGAAFC
jgi:hypothetical protein